MAIIVPAVEDNAISLNIGLKFKLIQMLSNGRESEVQIMKSGQDHIFYGVFDEEDVDFKIVVNNVMNDKKILFSLDVANKQHSFVMTKGQGPSTLRALETNGKHLHFISQTTDEGKLLVAMSAKKQNTSYEEAAVLCSRIGFKVEVEKDIEIKGEKIEIFINSLTGKTVPINIGLKNTISDVKYLFQQIEDISTNNVIMRLIFFGKQLEDSKTLNDYNINRSSTLHCVLGFRGGGYPTESLNPNVGERGVVCFAQETDQKFDTYYKDFIPSEEYDIKSFILEMRLKPKYCFE